MEGFSWVWLADQGCVFHGTLPLFWPETDCSRCLVSIQRGLTVETPLVNL